MRVFSALKRDWYTTTLADLRLKLGQYPNLWRLSRLEQVDSAMLETSF